MSQECRLKTIDETRIYFLEEIKQNELIIRKHKKVRNCKLYWTLSYFISTITECISISDFTSLLGIPIEITSYAIELKIFAGIKKYKSITVGI